MIDRLPVFAKTGGRRLVKQSMAGDSDINVIMEKWHATGMLPQGAGRAPRYGDFSNGASFTEALFAVRDAEDAFLQLPSAVRSYCDNDPGKFLDLVMDPERREELEKLGLIKERMPVAAAVAASLSEGSASSSSSTPGGTPAPGGGGANTL